MRNIHFLIDNPTGAVRISDPEKNEPRGVWIDSHKGVWERVSAKEYDPEKHGKFGKCDDARCDAVMRRAKVDTGYAASGSADWRFSSVSADAHRKGCTAHKVYEVSHNTVKLSEAIKDGSTRIIVSLGFNVGHPDFKKSGKGLAPENQDTPYNRYRGKYPHATLSEKTRDGFDQQIERRERLSPEALDRTVIAHAQDVRKFKTFDIGDNVERMKAMIAAMVLLDSALPEKEKRRLSQIISEEGDLTEVFRAAAQHETRHKRPSHILHAFPHKIIWTPNNAEANNRYADGFEIAGRRIVLAERGVCKFELENVLQLQDETMRPKIMRYGAVDYIGSASFASASFLRAWNGFHYGRKRDAVLRAIWTTVSPEQYRPAEGTVIYPETPPEGQQRLDVTIP